MIIFPAIDVLDNRAVRLLYGKRDKVTDYGSPIERANKWREQGAEYLHLVDLNGAFDDSNVNLKTLKEVVKEVQIPVQIGGGIKSLDKVKLYLEEVGVDRVIVGSALVTNRDMVEKAFAKYGAKIACGIDVLNGKVCIKGWLESVNLTALQLAMDMKTMGAEVVIYTDISRDGALCGVNVNSTAELQSGSGLKVIASGGMTNMKDVDQLVAKDIYGAILGRSIYENTINLATAIGRAKKC